MRSLSIVLSLVTTMTTVVALPLIDHAASLSLMPNLAPRQVDGDSGSCQRLLDLCYDGTGGSTNIPTIVAQGQVWVHVEITQ